jgi:hypothetical protein
MIRKKKQRENSRRLCSVLGSYVRGANDVAAEQGQVLIKLQQLASSYENHYTKQWYTLMGPALSLSVLIATATLKLQCTYEACEIF